MTTEPSASPARPIKRTWSMPVFLGTILVTLVGLAGFLLRLFGEVGFSVEWFMITVLGIGWAVTYFFGFVHPRDDQPLG